MAAYSASSGYVLGLPPACLGAPKAISFRVTMYYDTKPNDDKAPVATDVAPDKGLAGPAAVASGATSTTSPASIASPHGTVTAGSVAARVGPGQPFEERKGMVALVAIVAVLLAWAGLVMVLAQGRRLRTAAL